jgi:integrase/recombinase XerD
LRRALYRHISFLKLTPEDLLLGNRRGTEWPRRNITRDVRRLCRIFGFEPPARTLHAFRHTFAVNYLRRGGSTFHLQKSLGHTTLEMTRRYANLTTDDLSAVHRQISLLSR